METAKSTTTILITALIGPIFENLKSRTVIISLIL